MRRNILPCHAVDEIHFDYCKASPTYKAWKMAVSSSFLSSLRSDGNEILLLGNAVLLFSGEVLGLSSSSPS